MTQIQRNALFKGLVYDEDGNLLNTTFVGSEPHYVIMDDDFKRHITSEMVDRQVLVWIQGQAEANKDMVTEQVMNMIGKNDLFTKAMIASSLGNMEQAIQNGIPDDARIMLGMMGFKIVINMHGKLINLDMPGQESPDDEW